MPLLWAKLCYNKCNKQGIWRIYLMTPKYEGCQKNFLSAFFSGQISVQMMFFSLCFISIRHLTLNAFELELFTSDAVEIAFFNFSSVKDAIFTLCAVEISVFYFVCSWRCSLYFLCSWSFTFHFLCIPHFVCNYPYCTMSKLIFFCKYFHSINNFSPFYRKKTYQV